MLQCDNDKRGLVVECRMMMREMFSGRSHGVEF